MARVLGWHVVVKKGEFKVGDKCVYFEIDSILPPDNPDFAFLLNSKGKMKPLKTKRIRGVISQGLVMPLSVLHYEGNIEEGQDVENIKAMITEQIKEYVNSIPIGEYLTYGKINQIGTNMKGVSFFNTANIIIDGQDMSALKRLQIIKTKFIFDRIYWSEVEN